MGEFSTAMFLISIGLFLLISLCIPLGIALLVYKLARKWLRRSIAIVIASIIPLFCIYEVYFAIYPDDDFYKGEFKLVTGMKCPQSAKVISKDASYPVWQGEYSSCAIIEFSTDDYLSILETVKKDSLLTEGGNWGSPEQVKVTKVHKPGKIVYGASYNKDDYFRYIGFYDDGKTIIIHYSKT
jgi:hypothetical protein